MQELRFYYKKIENILKDRLMSSFSHYSRRKKYSVFKKYLLFSKNKPSTILDIGCGLGEFLEEYLSSDLKNKNLLKNVIGLDLRKDYLNELCKKYEIKQTIVGDVCNLPFEEQSIDLVCSNAVLEHIPTEKQGKFASEVERVAKNYWIACPSKFSLIEVHYYLPFVGWLKTNVRDKILRFFGIKLHFDPINLLSFKEFKSLWKNATEFRKVNIFRFFEHFIAIKS